MVVIKHIGPTISIFQTNKIPIMSFTLRAILYNKTELTNALKYLFIADNVLSNQLSKGFIFPTSEMLIVRRISNSPYSTFSFNELITLWKLNFADIVMAYLSEKKLYWPLEHFVAATMLFYTKNYWISTLLFKIVTRNKIKICVPPQLYIHAAIAHQKLRNINQSLYFLHKGLKCYIALNQNTHTVGNYRNQIAVIDAMVKLLRLQKSHVSGINNNRNVNQCLFCAEVKRCYLCSKCKSAYYCNKACQKRDWKQTHRKECTLHKEKNNKRYKRIASTYLKKYISINKNEITINGNLTFNIH